MAAKRAHLSGGADNQDEMPDDHLPCCEAVDVSAPAHVVPECRGAFDRPLPKLSLTGRVEALMTGNSDIPVFAGAFSVPILLPTTLGRRLPDMTGPGRRCVRQTGGLRLRSGVRTERRGRQWPGACPRRIRVWVRHPARLPGSCQAQLTRSQGEGPCCWRVVGHTEARSCQNPLLICYIISYQVYEIV